MTKKTYIDPTAEVHPKASIGEGVMIWNWTKVRENATIGENTNVGQCAYVDFEVSIGCNCKIQNGVSIYNGASISDDVFVGPNVTFTNDLRPRAYSDDWEITPTVIKEGVSIGANSTIICGTILSEHCMIAAGAVVTTDVPAYALVMGCPARIVDYVAISGKRLHVDVEDGIPDTFLLQDK